MSASPRSSNAGDLVVAPLPELARRRSEKWQGHDAGVIAATVAEMDFPLAAPIRDALSAAIARDDVGYPPSAPAGLFDAFAGFAGRRMGWQVDVEQVSLAPDVVVAIVELARELAGDAGRVAFTAPAYPPFFREIRAAGLIPQPLPSSSDGPFDDEALEAALRGGTRVVILTNPHNPTGAVATREELAALAERCAAHGAWLLADEIHAPLVLDGATHVPWLEVSDAARACGIALTSGSKAFNLAGLKAALIVTGSGPAADVVRRLPILGGRAGLLGVLASEAGFRDGDAWLDGVLVQLAANRALLVTEVAARVPEIRWTAPAGTYLAWLDCRGLALGEDPAASFLHHGRLALADGRIYGAPGAGHVRLNFGTSADLVGEMIDRMAATAAAHR